MSSEDELVRLNPFEGLCLTATDLLVEQRYHRANLRRHARFLSGHGVVQGLSVELQQKLDRYEVTVKAGYGLTAQGQGIQLRDDLVLTLEPQEADGEYMLWLVHMESEDPDSNQPVFDTSDVRPSRIVERVESRLLPADEDRRDGVALARIRVRLGRMAHIRIPVPRAGRVMRAAESYLKPRVLEFVELNRKAMQLLFRTAVLQELSIASYGFYAALVSAEFLLIEEGTADRVLYRSAGGLVRHGRQFYDSDAVRELTDRVSQVSALLRTLDDGIPQASHEDRQWQNWFEQFERILPPLQRMTEELQATVEATKE
jgi:hypothetical protein